jgi:hypothetical protein
VPGDHRELLKRSHWRSAQPREVGIRQIAPPSIQPIALPDIKTITLNVTTIRLPHVKTPDWTLTGVRLPSGELYSVTGEEQWRPSSFVPGAQGMSAAIGVPGDSPARVESGEPAEQSLDSNALPDRACFLLDLLLSKADREEIPGDLEEEFWTSILPKYGPARARFWFWTQTLRTIATRNRLCRWLLIGGLARVGEWILRKIGG